MFNIIILPSDEKRPHSSFDVSVYKIYGKQQQKRKASKDSAVSSKTNTQGNEETSESFVFCRTGFGGK